MTDEGAFLARAHGSGILRPRARAMRGRYPEMAGSMRAMKLAALRDGAALLRQAVDQLRANGFEVSVTSTAEEAVARVAAILEPPGLVVKSKSNLSKELHLRSGLERHGNTVIETDLGDRIVQLAGVQGFHVLSPADSVPRGTIRRVLSEQAGRELADSASDMVAGTRDAMRRYFLEADYGLTGANAIAADVGAICLVENEGNIRAASSLPRVHVVVAGIHKIVPTLEDAFRVVQGASVFGAGQRLGNYVSCITGPGDGVAGPERVHVVLVDDGRSRLLASGWEEAFACINCGACLSHCPTYAEVGDAFAFKRACGIGALQTALLDGPEAGALDGASLCIGCGACVRVCPVALDTPGLLDRLKEEVGLVPPALTVRLVRLGVAGRRRVGLVGSAGRAYLRSGLRPLVRRAGLGRLPRPGAAESLLPAGAAAAKLPAFVGARSQERARVLFFKGCLADELLGGTNRNTVEVIARNGGSVTIPEGQMCCGAVHAHTGDEATARRLARRNVDAFPGEDPIITNAGGCGAQLKLYGRILADDPDYRERAARFASRVRDLSEFLVDVGLENVPPLPGVRLAYHDSCHLALCQGLTEEPRAVLRAIPGLELEEMPPGESCCGSGGLWSVQHPELGARLGRRRAALARESTAPTIVTGNPGCLLHLRSQGADVVHVADVLARAYAGGRDDSGVTG